MIESYVDEHLDDDSINLPVSFLLSAISQGDNRCVPMLGPSMVG